MPVLGNAFGSEKMLQIGLEDGGFYRDWFKNCRHDSDGYTL